MITECQKELGCYANCGDRDDEGSPLYWRTLLRLSKRDMVAEDGWCNTESVVLRNVQQLRDEGGMEVRVCLWGGRERVYESNISRSQQ